jgi:hypothetical protein
MVEAQDSTAALARDSESQQEIKLLESVYGGQEYVTQPNKFSHLGFKKKLTRKTAEVMGSLPLFRKFGSE